MTFEHDGRIAVKSLKIGVGMNENGQVVQVSHSSAPNKQIFVVSGRYAVIEVTNQVTGHKIIAEVPLSAFGWEYEVVLDA